MTQKAAPRIQASLLQTQRSCIGNQGRQSLFITQSQIGQSPQGQAPTLNFTGLWLLGIERTDPHPAVFC